MSATFTCITCRVAFDDFEIQRAHYKTDWHRYNLKRKVVGIPPVNAEEFNRRVFNQREQDATESQEVQFYCKLCRKSFSNQKATDNHLNSNKHKQKLALASSDESRASSSESSSLSPVIRRTVSQETDTKSMDVDSDVEEVDSDEWEDDWQDEDNPIFNNNCLFCSHHSRSLLKNLKHMGVAHSFFIPDADYLADPRGLLMYLGEKVCQGFMCLWCNERTPTFHSAEAVKQHMADKGHWKMLFEGSALAEYADFYDYTKSYPDGGADPDEEVEVPVLDGGEYQLRLPSGTVIGHRSLMVYYKQSLKAEGQLALPSKKRDAFLSTYRALGWTETEKAAAVKRARDIQVMRRYQAKHAVSLGVKANKLQRHFRAQTNF